MKWFNSTKTQANPVSGVKPKEEKMKATLQYIDEVVVKECENRDVKPTEQERQQAANNSRKLIAGFRVKDEEEESKLIDALLAKKRSRIAEFLADRKELTDILRSKDITPLAIVPRQWWKDICQETGLFIMAPDKFGRVGFDARNLHRKYKERNFIQMEELFKNSRNEFLLSMFPNMHSLPTSSMSYGTATLMLPDPPEDVAKTLLKASNAKLGLKVAAVPEAISFVEKPYDIVTNSRPANPKDRWAQEQGYADYADWVKRDPIVFHEGTHSVAIIAQFGDFPIEKEVVDKVIGVSSMISNNVEVETVRSAVDDNPYIEAERRLRVTGHPIDRPRYFGEGDTWPFGIR